MLYREMRGTRCIFYKLFVGSFECRITKPLTGPNMQRRETREHEVNRAYKVITASLRNLSLAYTQN